MKKTNKVQKIFSWIESYTIQPLSKLAIKITNMFNKVYEQIDIKWDSRSSLLVISLIVAISIFIVSDKKIIKLKNKNADVLYNQKVTALYNDEEYVVEGMPKTVDVTIIGKEWDLYLAKQFPAKEVKVDLKKLKVGTHKVKLNYEQTVASVEYKIDPSEITVNVYNKVSDKKRLSYDLLNRNNIDNRYTISNVTLNQDYVIIKGKEYDLKRVSAVKALIDLKKLGAVNKDGYVTIGDIPLVAFDERGNKINVEIVSKKIEASIKMSSPSKVVPIKVFTKGNLSTKAIKHIDLSNNEVEIFGNTSTLQKIEYLPVELDITGLENDKNFTVNLVKPYGITDTSIKTINLKLTVGDLVKKEISGVTVNYRNIGEGLIAQGVDSSFRNITIEMRGTKEALSHVEKASIQAYVDLSNHSVGTYETEISVIGDDPRIVYVPKVKKIKVNIYKK